jgi:hypothetical protein
MRDVQGHRLGVGREWKKLVAICPPAKIGPVGHVGPLRSSGPVGVGVADGGVGQVTESSDVVLDADRGFTGNNLISDNRILPELSDGLRGIYRKRLAKKVMVGAEIYRTGSDFSPGQARPLWP